MGAWGTGIYENDTACDWAYELEECDDLTVILDAIECVFGEDYVDSDFACEALAAIDTLARLKGNPAGESCGNETVDQWIAEHPINPPQMLVERAKKALKAILGEESELCELWAETDDFEKWTAGVVELARRLEG